MTTRHIARLATFLVAFIPAVASAQTLTFDDVSTNSGGLNPHFSSYNGFTFEGFNVATTTSLGTGTNATSGTKFALGREDFSSIFRVGDAFDFLGASLSFRQYDATSPDNGPVGVNVFGYRAGTVAAVYTQFISLSSNATRFQFDFTNIEEVVFETGALTAGGRSSALALDDARLAVVPEPSTVLLMAVGMAGVLAVVHRTGSRRA
jgi:hypothetical protein